MRFLYCVDDLSPSGPEGDLSRETFVAELERAGHSVEEVLSLGHHTDAAESREAHRIDLDDDAACVEESTDMGYRNFASMVFALVQEKELDGVIARGLKLSHALVGTLGSRLWSILPTADLNEIIDWGRDGTQVIREVVHNTGITLVDDDEKRAVLQRALPNDGHKILYIPTRMGRSTGTVLTRLGNFLGARHRVLIYQGSEARTTPESATSTYNLARALASRDVHIVLMCQDASIFSSFPESFMSEYVTVIEPSPAAHQIVEGLLQPRFAAWHVAVAAEQLNCSVVLTDDLETVRFGKTNDGLRPKLWPVLRFADLQSFNDQRGTFEDLADWVSRLVVSDEHSRAVLESRIPSSTSKTLLLSAFRTGLVVIPAASEPAADRLANDLEAYLNRFVPDYTQVARLQTPLKVVMAGHDFKFAGELLDVLARREDVELRADLWTTQNVQNIDVSRALLGWADIIFCEFASNNAVWYSWGKKPGQTLIVRFHGYELWSSWIQDINLSNVDKIVFVSDFYRDKVVEELGWPLDKTAVIPNVVDVVDLNRPKRPDAQFHIGIAGIVPILKRPDRALDLLEMLLESDSRYTLHVRGRSPWEYGWMWKDDGVRDAYEAFYERLAVDPSLRRRVSFEGFGPDMGRWFQSIGWMLSPSFRETFHLAPVEGMASGAIPVVWEREGADEIFGEQWVHEDTLGAAKYIISVNENVGRFASTSSSALEHARRFDILENGRKWVRLLLETEGEHSQVPSENIRAARLEEIFEAEATEINLSRLMRVLLRDGDEPRIHELAGKHPEIVTQLPSDIQVKFSLRALKEDQSLIPRRSRGAAYLVRPDTVLWAVSVDPANEPIGGQADYSDVVSKPDTLLRPVAVTVSEKGGSHAVDQGGRYSFEFEGYTGVTLRLRNSFSLGIDKLVLAAADALVREARAFRPAAIAAAYDLRTALPALIAARRIGVPFLLESHIQLQEVDDEELSARIRAEADAFFTGNESPLGRLADGVSNYENSLEAVPQRSLSELRIGVIADEFTSRTIAQSFEIVPLSRADGYLQVSSLDLDAIFIESAWEGPNQEWRRGVAYYPETIDDLRRIIRVANARSIPVLFWNKEDPVHFAAFERTAAMVDHVFTTDADMVGKYLRTPATLAQTVSSMPFYAEPRIHNALPTNRIYDHSVSYAGTYYGKRFAERSVELHQILDAAKRHGLTIYDRQVNVPDSPYKFPPELSRFVREGLPYEEVLEVYKSHPVNINVNSANDSPTMFSRRVVEIAASGSVVLSGRGRGITEQLQGIEAAGSYDRWAELLETWMTNERERLDEAWRQMRTVTRSHLAEHSLTIMMRTAGLSVAALGLPAYALWSKSLSESDALAILDQTCRPKAVWLEYAATDVVQLLARNGVVVQTGVAESEALESKGIGWIGRYSGGLPITHYEDLLHATRFGEWSCLASAEAEDPVRLGEPLLRSGSVHNLDGALFNQLDTDEVHSFTTAPVGSPERPGLTWRV